LGSQHNGGVLSTSKVWDGKGSSKPSRPIGCSKPKAKVVFKRKHMSGLGVSQAVFKPDPKGKAPASREQHSSPATSSSARPWVRLDAGQASDPGAMSSASGFHTALQTPIHGWFSHAGCSGGDLSLSSSGGSVVW